MQNKTQIQASQLFSVITTIVLAIIFFIFLDISVRAQQNFLTPLVLIIIAIILLAIFAELVRLEGRIAVKGGGRK